MFMDIVMTDIVRKKMRKIIKVKRRLRGNCKLTKNLKRRK